QAEDGIRDLTVTGVQTCALPIYLKPANILVGESGAKVADFGLAQLGVDASVPTLTRTNVAMGTFHYLAPEQRKDAHAVDHRADRSEEHTSELQSQSNIVCRPLLE